MYINKILSGKEYVVSTCRKLNFPSPIIKNEIDSTSTYLRSLAEKGAPHGTVVIAKRQSAGRGRTGKSFLSPDGGLYMSILLRCDFPPEITDITTPTVAVATAIAIKEAMNIDTSVKWVNDLFFSGKKVCGILTEVARDSEDGHIKYVVIGIGVNVFEPRRGFGELSHIAGSLLPFKTNTTLIYQLASLITENFFRLWNGENIELIYDEYKKRLFILGNDIYVLRADEKIPAKVIDLEKDFSLTVEYRDARQEKLTSGEISIIPQVNS